MVKKKNSGSSSCRCYRLLGEKGSQRKSLFLEGSVQSKETPELSLKTQTNQEGFVGRVTLQFIFQTGVDQGKRHY